MPGVGIFTQPDTIVPDTKNPQALNRYGYVLNNPMRFVDPTGHRYEEGTGSGEPVQDWYAPACYVPTDEPVEPIGFTDAGASYSSSPMSDSGPGISASQPLSEASTMQLPTKWEPGPTEYPVKIWDGISVVNNVGWPMGDFVRQINGGADAALTWDSKTIYVTNDLWESSVSEDTRFLRLIHEYAHTKQAQRLGSSYLLAYAATWASFRLQGKSDSEIHGTVDNPGLHPMEREAFALQVAWQQRLQHYDSLARFAKRRTDFLDRF